jgi:hypothetical protein
VIGIGEMGKIYSGYKDLFQIFPEINFMAGIETQRFEQSENHPWQEKDTIRIILIVYHDLLLKLHFSGLSPQRGIIAQ